MRGRQGRASGGRGRAGRALSCSAGSTAPNGHLPTARVGGLAIPRLSARLPDGPKRPAGSPPEERVAWRTVASLAQLPVDARRRSRGAAAPPVLRGVRKLCTVGTAGPSTSRASERRAESATACRRGGAGRLASAGGCSGRGAAGSEAAVRKRPCVAAHAGVECRARNRRVGLALRRLGGRWQQRSQPRHRLGRRPSDGVAASISHRRSRSQASRRKGRSGAARRRQQRRRSVQENHASELCQARMAP